ncbi:energy-coupling factor transporter transmembrane component T [Leifsonia sp. F6_8S_P_1B]|uniref:Energy-coupling factor transporter transmembrane component T n=1 Tax=Leifsonia williamsii TaxID=3035919 RepID=A0ABT8KFQ7_9MICO|nr:energy-coupling factor transporter transmembrane component T [Leifsonia williamsii]MDN4616284.1 energy-coupling factor transporter transmembrane component T [Leifsonia williamsii]
MLTLYRPGDGLLHRMPAGPKLLLVLAVVLAVSLLPSAWWAAAVATVVAVACYLIAGVGLAELGRQVLAVRWLIVVTLGFQLIFLGVEAAVANTARVTAAVVLAGLLVLTTRVTDLLDAVERGLAPLQRLRVDPQRVALLLTVTLGTVPVLARLAGEVREAQRARGGRASLRAFAVPFLVLALKHADQLGDALSARGVR